MGDTLFFLYARAKSNNKKYLKKEIPAGMLCIILMCYLRDLGIQQNLLLP